MRKKIFKSIFTATLITVMATTPVLADEISDLKAAQSQNQAEMDTTKNELTILLTQMDELENQAANLQTEMSSVNEQLDNAKAKQQEQYENMKLRIKFMYEKNDATFADAIFSSQSMGELLSKTEYVQQVYSYDRDMLDQMAATAKEISDLKNKLEEDEAALEASHESMVSKQALLYTTIDTLQASSEDITSQLTEAVAAAAAAHQAEVAAQQAAAAAVAQQAAAQQAQNTESGNVAASSDNSGSVDSSSSQSAGATSTPAPAPTPAPAAPSGDTSIGSTALSIAYSYYGVPYVYGGSSPSGFDCSGLTQYVYAQLGVSLPRSSAAQASAGYEVGLANIQPGDLVCYPGHVAIYAGGGIVFNATHEGDICRESPIGMSTIIAVRRVY